MITCKYSIKIQVALVALFMVFLSSASCGPNAFQFRYDETPKLRVMEPVLSKAAGTVGPMNFDGKPSYEFYVDDPEVVATVKILNVTGRHEIRWEWIDPEGQVFNTTGNHALKEVPAGKYQKEVNASHRMSIHEGDASALPGRWTLRFYLDDKLEHAVSFRIIIRNE